MYIVHVRHGHCTVAWYISGIVFFMKWQIKLYFAAAIFVIFPVYPSVLILLILNA